MRCKHCGYETNSDSIFFLHENTCIEVQQENGLIQQEKPYDNVKLYKKMGLPELQKYATEKGIDVKDKKKDEIIEALIKQEGGQNDNNSGEGKGDPSNSNK